MVYQPNSIGPLCEDLLVNVICRLPERDVLRCKCVSKEWHQIVSHVCIPWLSVHAPISGIYFRVAQGPEVPFVTSYSPQEAKDEVNHVVAYNHSVHYIGTASLKPNFECLWRYSCVKKPSLNLLRDAKDEPPPGCIAVSNGFLSYVTIEDEHVCVWLLDKPNESSQWTLKYRICVRPLWNSLKKGCLYGRTVWLRPCGFHPTSGILFLGSAGKLFMYHIGSGRLETVRYLLFRELHCGYYFPFFVHKNVLVTLKNWCKDVITKNDDYEVVDNWCYFEQ